GPHNQRNHDKTQGQASSVSREAFEAQNYQAIHHDAPGDRRNTVEHVSEETENGIDSRGPVLSEINSTQHADRNSNYAGNSEQFERTDDCIRHSATRGSHRCRQFGEEGPVHRTSAVDKKVKKHKTERRDHKSRRNEGNYRGQRAFESAPRMVV